MAVEEDKTTCVEIHNLSSILDFKAMRELFQCCGKIRSIDLRRYKSGGRVCFIEFSMPAEAAAAVFLEGTQLGDLPIKVTRMSHEEVEAAKMDSVAIENHTTDQKVVQNAVKKVKQLSEIQDSVEQAIRDDELERTIYCGNLGPQVTEEHIKKIFSSCGRVLFVKIQSPRSEHNPLGSQYAFIEFETAEGAQKAFALNGLMLGERGLKLGKATNPIYKTGTGLRPRTILPPHRIKDAMNLVEIAVGRLHKRKREDGGSAYRERSEDRRRSPRRYSRRRSISRSRSRRGRIRRRSPSYDRRRGGGRSYDPRRYSPGRRGRSRSYERKYDRRRSPPYEAPQQGSNPRLQRPQLRLNAPQYSSSRYRRSRSPPRRDYRRRTPSPRRRSPSPRRRSPSSRGRPVRSPPRDGRRSRSPGRRSRSPMRRGRSPQEMKNYQDNRDDHAPTGAQDMNQRPRSPPRAYEQQAPVQQAS